MGRIVWSVARSRVLAAGFAAVLAGAASAASPQYFGFAWVHSRSAASTPYAFVNIDVRPVYVSDPATAAAGESRSLWEWYGVSSILGFNDFLYGEGNTTSVPRPDAIPLFDAWWEAAGRGDAVRPPWVVAIWPADETMARCAGATDVPACVQPYLDFVSHVRDALAGTGVVLADSYDPTTVANGLLAQEAGDMVAAGIRWFGYHHYGVLHPLGDPAYEADVQTVRSLVDAYRAYGARFALVGDGFHDAGHSKVVDGTLVPWDWSDHRTVLDEDFQVACRNDAVALIVFNWPSFPGLGQEVEIGSAEFQDPAACWEACLGRVVKFGETTCDLCGGVSVSAGCRPPRSLRRHLRRP